jgi:hypothetical protein
MITENETLKKRKSKDGKREKAEKMSKWECWLGSLFSSLLLYSSSSFL